MVQLAIVGHETRGKEVIEILEMLGGKTSYDCGYKDGFDSSYFFFIDENFYIDGFAYNSKELKNCYIITLEEFLEKFPYKVGDKVLYHEYKAHIASMRWGEVEVIYNVEYKNEMWETTRRYLRPYKEETMEEKLMPRIDLTRYCKDKYILDLGDYEIKEENGVTYMIHKQPQYPKTYAECCDVIDYRLLVNTMIGHKVNILEPFQKLLICRDAYWKIAGEQMGLGKPWEPNWKKPDERKYCITNTEGNIAKWVQKTTNKILAFPTEEMRDAFYGNFKKSIEECKEFL